MNWQSILVDDACERIIDYRGKTPKKSDAGIRLITAKVIKGGRINEEPAEYITESEYDRWMTRGIPEKGDVLLTTEAPLGEVAILRTDEKIALAQRSILLRADKEKLDSKFLLYVLQSPLVQGRLNARATGTTVMGIKNKELRKVEIPLPPIKEQRSIAKKLADVDDLIENNRRRIQLLEESARLLYKEWFVHLRFPGHEHVKIIDGVPEGWESGTVIDFYKTTSGGTPSRKNMDFYAGDINWVKTGELVDSFIFTTKEKITEEAIARSSAKIFPKGSVLVAMYGATIGRTGILAEPSASNQACCALIPNNDLANTIHAYLFLRENKAGLINLAKGAAQNNISQNIIKSYPMVMPPTFLMEIFHSSLKDSFEQLKILQQQNVRLVQARDILLPRLMNGELTV